MIGGDQFTGESAQATSQITSQMDWVFFTIASTVFPDHSSNALQMALDPEGTGIQTSEPVQSSPVGSLLEQTRSEPDGPGGPEDRWPMDWQAVPVQLSSLPTLEEGYQVPLSIHYSTASMNDSALFKIYEYLELSLNTSPWQPVSLESLPGREPLNHFVDLYFVHFHEFYPAIHRPSFEAAKEPVLTLAIAVIGACYSGFPSARAFATSLSELTRRLLLFMAEYDPRFIRTESYITAQFVQSLHGLSSGSKRLFELVKANQSSVISHARGLKLFEEHSSPMDRAARTDVRSRWEIWIRAEKARRLAWAILSVHSMPRLPSSITQGPFFP